VSSPNQSPLHGYQPLAPDQHLKTTSSSFKISPCIFHPSSLFCLAHLAYPISPFPRMQQTVYLLSSPTKTRPRRAHALKVVKNSFREFCLHRRQAIYSLSYYSPIPNVQFAHPSNSFPPTSLNIYPFFYCPNNSFPYYILTIPDNNAHSNNYTNTSSQLYNLSFHPPFPSFFFPPTRILLQTLSLFSSHHKPLIQTLNHPHTFDESHHNAKTQAQHPRLSPPSHPTSLTTPPPSTLPTRDRLPVLPGLGVWR